MVGAIGLEPMTPCL